jgi:hypothetical protein
MNGPEHPHGESHADLEIELQQLLREEPSPVSLHALDARVARVAAAGPASARGRLARLGSAIGLLGATALVAFVAVVMLWSRAADGPAATPVVTHGAVADSDASPVSGQPPAATLVPSEPALQSEEPSLEPVPTPTATPEPDPTVDDTPKQHAQPTPKPTPKPTREPAPGGEAEPTPRTFTGSGSLGQPVTIRRATLTMSRTDVPADIGDVCARKGWDTWAYDIRLDWSVPPGGTEPYVSVGGLNDNQVWWEREWKPNTDQIVVVCHDPADGGTVHADLTPDGIPITTYIWRFTP